MGYEFRVAGSRLGTGGWKLFRPEGYMLPMDRDMMRDEAMAGKLVDKMTLDNGLTLEVYDHSRRVAGDRWLVDFEARIDVPVVAEHVEDQDSENSSLDAIQNAVGAKVTYTYKKSRNFIAEKEKDKVFNGLKGRFVETTLPYFSGANFPRKVILSKYQELQGVSKPVLRS